MTTEQKYYHIISYGCQMNESDAEHFAGQLKNIGYTYTNELKLADVIVINTCCVRESAERKIYGKIGELKRLKAQNPELIICIAGCMAQKEKTALFKKAPHIDLILGTHNINQLGKLIAAYSHERIAAVNEAGDDLSLATPAVRKSSISAWVPIMYGCNNFCTYCIVPYVRGREQSRAVDDIIDEIAKLGQKGFKEITLLGQNVNSYGKDKDSHADFADLLARVDKIPRIERIRYMTSHPRDMNEKVIETIKSSTKICEHFHLPIQSGSDNILKQMNRGYTTAAYRNLITTVRERIPNASLTTDLIVGFPGETDEEFQETLAFMQEIRFDAAYTFLYSKRSGTPAAKMAEQVPLATKKARLQQLMDVQNEISLEINKKLTGQTVEVLVEGPSKHDDTTMTGRTRTNKIVLWKKLGTEYPGQLLNVTITKAQTWVLKGSVQK